MKVGLLTLYLRLPAILSLKEKRSIVKTLLTDVQRFGAALAAAEVSDLDNRHQAVIRVAHVSNDSRRTTSVLTKLRSRLEHQKDYILERYELEIL
jgi:uncharacterized protein YlxP (DUF503 family)